MKRTDVSERGLVLAPRGRDAAIALRNAFSFERIEALNAQLASEKLYLEDEIRGEHGFEEIIGRSLGL